MQSLNEELFQIQRHIDLRKDEKSFVRLVVLVKTLNLNVSDTDLIWRKYWQNGWLHSVDYLESICIKSSCRSNTEHYGSKFDIKVIGRSWVDFRNLEVIAF